MKHISLFSGIGGIDLAAEWAGFTTILFVEKDPLCQKVLQKHWPGVPIIGDVKDVKGNETEGAITLITGGFPCQPFSTAGERKGQADDRFLWPEMFRVISEVRPHWIVAENVTGILSMGGIDVLSNLESCGYETTSFLIPACSLGARHKRNRVFFVAHNNSQRGARTKGVSQGGGNLGNSRDTNHNHNEGRIQTKGEAEIQNRFDCEPRVGRMVPRSANGVDRLRSLGNAVVPQQVYPILKAIADIENYEGEQR